MYCDQKSVFMYAEVSVKVKVKVFGAYSHTKKTTQ